MENTGNSSDIKLIIATILFVIGIGFITFGIVNIMKGGATIKDNNSSISNNENNNSTITITDDDVKSWLDSNKVTIDYLIDYNNDFSKSTANKTNFSDIFGYYFVYRGNNESKTLEGSKYTYEYTISKEDALSYLQNVFGVGLDMFDVNSVTLSKDYYNFTSDDNSIKVQVVATETTPNLKSVLNNINIISDDEVEVTYGMMDYASTCDSTSSECFKKYRLLTLKKTDDGFNILACNDSEQ